MDNLRGLIGELRGLYTQVRSDRSNNRPVERVQTVIRNKVKEQLTRTDLRIPVEAALVEILHEFDGFDSSDEESQELVLVDTEKLLNRIESLIETESAVNSDRRELPEPPPVTADIVAQEMRKIEEEDSRKRRREHEARHPRPVEEDRSRREQPSGRDTRDHREPREPRAPQQPRRPRPNRPEGERPPRPPQEGSAPPAHPPGPERSDLKFQKDPPAGGDSGGSRRRRRGRRRP